MSCCVQNGMPTINDKKSFPARARGNVIVWEATLIIAALDRNEEVGGSETL